MKTRRQFRLYPAWEDVREAAWLEEQAAKGWQLESVGWPGIYRFREAPPAAVSYRMDYFSGKDRGAWLNLFEEAGWQPVCSCTAYHYFRNAAGSGKEIFTDRSSLLQRYRRIQAFLLCLLPSQLFGIIILQRALRNHQLGTGLTVFFTALTALFLVSSVLFSIGLVRLSRRMKELALL